MTLLFCIGLTRLWAKVDAALSAQRLARELGEPKVGRSMLSPQFASYICFANSIIVSASARDVFTGERLHCECKLLSDRRREITLRVAQKARLEPQDPAPSIFGPSQSCAKRGSCHRRQFSS
jgi:hypothetical protein